MSSLRNGDRAMKSFPEKLDGVVMISVTPALVARAVLQAIDTLLVLGDRPQEMLREFQGPDFKDACTRSAAIGTGQCTAVATECT